MFSKHTTNKKNTIPIAMLEMLQSIFITENNGQYMEDLLSACYKSTENK